MAITLNRMMAQDMMNEIKRRKVAKQMNDYVAITPADLGMDEIKDTDPNDIIYH
jgi:hypothetical protein